MLAQTLDAWAQLQPPTMLRAHLHTFVDIIIIQVLIYPSNDYVPQISHHN